jgi:hypothetical protein
MFIMDRNYLLTYKDDAFQMQFSWFEDEKELIDFIDTHVVEVIECVHIIQCEDLTDNFK